MVQRKSKKILIIFSDFYPEITKNLLIGAETFLKKKLTMRKKE